jgi:hypothetical protein
MRLQHRHLGVEGGLDLGQLDLPLRLDLEMDRVVLRLLLDLGPAEMRSLIELRSSFMPAASGLTAAGGGGRLF